MFLVTGKKSLEDYYQNSKVWPSLTEEEKKELDKNFYNHDDKDIDGICVVIEDKEDLLEFIPKDDINKKIQIEVIEETDSYRVFLVLANNDFLYEINIISDFLYSYSDEEVVTMISNIYSYVQNKCFTTS